MRVIFNKNEIEFNPDFPVCPTCGGKMWDNRQTKKNPKLPDFKCRNAECIGEKGYVTGVYLSSPRNSLPSNNPSSPASPGKVNSYGKNEKWMAIESAYKTAGMIYEGSENACLEDFKKLAREIYKDITSEELNSAVMENIKLSPGLVGTRRKLVDPDLPLPGDIEEEISGKSDGKVQTLDDMVIAAALRVGYKEPMLNYVMTTIVGCKIPDWRLVSEEIKLKAIEKFDSVEVK